MTKEILVKVTVVGDANVGKTSLIRRYAEGRFDSSRVATIGVDFQTKTVPLPYASVKLSIWDMAGQEHFRFVREGFYRGSRATALVYDVTDIDSLKNLIRWRQEVLAENPGQKFVVVGNKVDLEGDQAGRWGPVLAERIQAKHLRTSALTGEGVKDLFMNLALLAIGRKR